MNYSTRSRSSSSIITENEKQKLLTDADEPEGMATVSGSVFNLVNTIVGGGVLALPYAFAICGLLLGIFFLLFVAGLSFFSLVLLIQCTEISPKHHRSTFREIARLAHGSVGVIITDISLILACFGAMCSYLVIIADMVAPLLAYWTQQEVEEINRAIILCVTMVILLPLACLRYLNMYRYTSLFAVIAMLYLVIAVVVKSGKSMAEGSLWICQQEGCLSLAVFSFDFFRTIPIISFAFTCQMNFFTIFAELFEPTSPRMRIVCAISLSICSSLYLLIGMFGYLTFFEDVEGNILLNYDLDDPVIIVGRIGVAFVILFSFPLMAHPCVNTIDDLFFPKKDFSWLRRITIVSCLCVASLLIGLFVEDVSLIFGLTGATASTMISFILPATFFICLSPKLNTSLIKIGAWILCILGFAFMIASTTVTLIDEINPPSNSTANASL